MSPNAHFARFSFAISFALMLLSTLGSAQSKLDFLFVPPVLYDSGGYSDAIAVGDLNHDGKLDLIVLNCGPDSTCGGTGSVGVLLGNGDGTFQPATTYFSGGTIPNSITVADVNGDGRLDVLVANRGTEFDGFGESVLGVLLGNGDGTLEPVEVIDFGCASGVSSMTIADLNGDGKVDIVAGPLCDTYAVLLGRGDRTFQPPLLGLSGLGTVLSMAIGDVNHDSKPDLVLDLVLGSNHAIAILLGIGDGTFQMPVSSYQSDPYLSLVALADLNGDGTLDLVVANRYQNTLNVRLGNGDGTFQHPSFYAFKTPYATYPAVMSITTGDVNGDGKPDVLVSIQGNGVFLGKGDGTLQPLTVYNPIFAAEFVNLALGDVNGDGRPDLAFVRGDAIGVLLNNHGAPPTVTSLHANLNPITEKQAVTYSAKVTPQSGTVNGTVVFLDHGFVIGEVPVINNLASLSQTYNSLTPHVITAAYAGSLNTAAGSISRTLTENVSPNTTTTLLTSSLNPSIYGQKVMFTATVKTTGVPATGKVIFSLVNSGGTYRIGTVVLNSTGVATLTKSNLNVDSNALVAVYQGDSNYLTSTSNVVDQVITQTTSKATLTSSLNPSTFGLAVTFNARITSPTVLPMGPVTFTAGNSIVGTVQLNGGNATFTTTSLPIGSTVIGVTYHGNSNIAKSSAHLTENVH
jgi:hypothetical protein